MRLKHEDSEYYFGVVWIFTKENLPSHSQNLGIENFPKVQSFFYTTRHCFSKLIVILESK